MALRDNPYLPLYVQDFLTDEKLAECSAEATGVYIRLMCLMHKSEQYGQILLKQKDKQNAELCYNKTPNTIEIFAYKLAKQMPYSIDVIKRSLDELIDEKVLTVSEDILFQKRMVLDHEISVKRSCSGKNGMKIRYKKNDDKDICYNKELSENKDFVIANTLTNTENESVYVNDNNIKEEKGGVGEKTKVFHKPTLEEVTAYCKERGNAIDPQQWIDHYTANGWKVGKNHMLDWKAAVRTWERNGITNDINNGNNGQKRTTGATATDRHTTVSASSTKKTFRNTL